MDPKSSLSTPFLIGGTVIMAVGATIPFVAPSLNEAPWSDDWQELAPRIAGNPDAWVWANGLFLVAAVLTALGLVSLALRFQGGGRDWAWMGAITFMIAATLSVVDRIISMSVATWAAQAEIEASDITLGAFIRLDEGFAGAFFSLGFLSLSVFGVALNQERGGRSGIAFVVAGIVGLALSAFGAAIPAFVYFGTAALGAMTWRIDSREMLRH